MSSPNFAEYIFESQKANFVSIYEINLHICIFPFPDNFEVSVIRNDLIAIRAAMTSNRSGFKATSMELRSSAS